MDSETRSLDELLRLNSYQGMTDEEIEMVVNYRAQVAIEREEAQARNEALRNGIAAMQQQAYEAAELAQANFREALSICPNFKSVGDE